MTSADTVTSSDFSYNSIIDHSSDPKKITIKDTTDLAALLLKGYTLIGAFLKIRFTDSTGTTVLYDNLDAASDPTSTPDVPPNGQDSQNIVVKLDDNGDPAFGLYEVEAIYVYKVTGVSDTDLVLYGNTVSTSYTYEYVCPTVSIGYKVNLAASNIRSIDNTNYGNYTSLDRTHTISPPGAAMQPPLSLPAQTTSLKENVYTNITDGTWSVNIYSIVTYSLYTDSTNDLNWQVICEVDGCIEIPVFTSVDVNKLLCCMLRHKQRWESMVNKGRKEAIHYKEEVIDPMVLNLAFYTAAGIAGCENDANEALEKLKDITGCKDCDCQGDSCPTPIPSITQANNLYDLDSPQNTIKVTSSSTGNTTTFHIDISQTILDQLSQIKTYQATGIGIINVNTQTTGNVTTFTISASRPIPRTQNLAALLVTLENDGVDWSITKEAIFLDDQGGIVQSTLASHNLAFIPGSAGSSGINSLDTVAIKWDSFFLQEEKFIARAQVINAHYQYTYAQMVNVTSGYIKGTKILEAGVMWIENNSDGKGNIAIIRLYNPVNGEAVSFDDLNQGPHGPATPEYKIQLRIEVLAQTSNS